MFETSLLSAKRHRLQSRANKGSNAAKTAVKLIENEIDAVISTILLWNNFANVVIASAATLLAIQFISDDKTTLSITSILTTITILILAEITPKAIGVRYSEQIACFAAPILNFLIHAIPFGKLVGYILKSMEKSNGDEKKQNKTENRHYVQVEDLLAIIKDDNTLKDANTEHKALLYKVINLNALEIRDLMINRKDINYIDLEDSLAEINNQLAQTRHHILPLCEDGLENVKGVLRVRDVLVAQTKRNISKEDILKIAEKAIFIPETVDPIKALRELVGRKRQTALVVDEYGGLIGLVTSTDFFNHIFTATVATTEETNVPNEIAVVSGDELIKEINLNHSINLPEGDENNTTIAGLIIERLDAFPEKTGNEIFFDDLVLVVTELDELKIKQVSIRRSK